MPSLSSTASESRKLTLTRSRHSITSLDSRTNSVTSLTESHHVFRPSHGRHEAREPISKPESDHRHNVKKPVRSLRVTFKNLLTICIILQAYYSRLSRYDSVDEHAECARRYKRLNDKYEELKGRFSDLRYF